MNFKNVEKFEKWIKENVKKYYDNIDVYLDEVIQQHCSNGSNCYELSRIETKSGNSECYYYDVEIVEIEEDMFETTIIF